MVQYFQMIFSFIYSYFKMFRSSKFRFKVESCYKLGHFRILTSKSGAHIQYCREFHEKKKKSCATVPLSQVWALAQFGETYINVDIVGTICVAEKNLRFP